ncbi:MAG: hypothetical protein KKF41_05965 [Actinobacteria bacterium]|nr:hypothetical protein [Actinomycetota bacterium]MBU1944822.1 hypothetical protein [Actinomycetota bacterium]MBU2687111.1 hypothetical protein [Actinomycetota bacterium]
MFCWIFGRGCGSNREARENEKLREYTSEANKLISRSAATGTQFVELHDNIVDLTREEISGKLGQMSDSAKAAADETGKLVAPDKAERLQPLLQLSMDMRVSGLDKFRSGILDTLDNKDLQNATINVSEGMKDLLVSDAALERYRSSLDAKLQAAKISYEKTTPSAYVPNKDDATSAAVVAYVKDLVGEESGDELHGVAVTGLTTSPARVDETESGIAVLPFSDTFTVKVTVENQGNQEEQNIPVTITLIDDSGGAQQKETQKITRLKAGETATVIFEKLKPSTGTDKVNTMNVVAGPVRFEKKTDNNQMELQFVMKAQGT